MVKNTHYVLRISLLHLIERINLKEGDTVYIPAKTLHTHGSVNKKKTFSHIAINILPKKNSEYKTTWYESDFKTTVTKTV